MNKDRILEVADAIERHSVPNLGFSMTYYVTEANSSFSVDQSGQNCGTVACIAGWARALRLGGVIPEIARTSLDFHPELEMEWMGLSSPEGNELFFPARFATGDYYDDDLEDVKPSRAVAVLRHLAETGAVDWSIGEREE